jgi:hypothetical protein
MSAHYGIKYGGTRTGAAIKEENAKQTEKKL